MRLLCLLGLMDVAGIIEQLGADRIEDREAANRALRGMGAPALGPLREAWGDPDPEVAARAREAYYTIGSRLPVEERCSWKGDLHALSVSVQRRTGKTLLWTEDLGLNRRRATLISDLCLREHPNHVFVAYRRNYCGESRSIPRMSSRRVSPGH